MRTSKILIVSFLTIALFTWGCASVKTRTPLPEHLSPNVTVLGSTEMRMWGDVPPEGADGWFELSREELKAQFPDTFHSTHTYLAISGGGANGAFGAGLLTGWTERGDRPEFTMVSGVSIGALIAPFAFLGPAYDQQLKEIFTTVSTKDILKERGFLAIFTGDAVTSTAPLQELISSYFNQAMMNAIAAEHKRGRVLYIGTTQLDAGRPVLWDIGRIAASRHPEALELIQNVLLASASIPGIFPPVFIDVEANGNPYDEMHVDGGTAYQVFLYPTGMEWRKFMDKLEVVGSPTAYVIRNSSRKPEWRSVTPKIGHIAERTIESLIRTQGFGDLYRIYISTKNEGIDLNMAFIPDELSLSPKEPFDPEYMRQLFNIGYEKGKNGYPWKKKPPGFLRPL